MPLVRDKAEEYLRRPHSERARAINQELELTMAHTRRDAFICDCHHVPGAFGGGRLFLILSTAFFTWVRLAWVGLRA
jgi:hypothetical protein